MGLSSERATTRERDHQDDKEHDLDGTERAITIDRGKRARAIGPIGRRSRAAPS